MDRWKTAKAEFLLIMNTEYKYLRFINLSRFFRWDVKAYAFQHKEFNNAVLLQDILTPYDVPISKVEMIENEWPIISKINFSGKLFLRKIEETKSFKGSVHKVDGDTLIYSKINVRHGCVYYHSNGAIPFGVSSEYPAYKIDKKRVNGEFLVLLLQSQYFKDALSARTSGISKARVKPSVFLTVEIPLPSIEEQNKIVAAYKKSISLAKKYDEKAEQDIKGINKYLFDILGITQIEIEKTEQKKIYLEFYNYSDISQWGVDFIRKANIGYKSSLYNYCRVVDVCKISSGGTPSRGRKEYYNGNILWVKTGELKNDVINDTEEKITQLGLDNSSAKLYPAGSLIIAMYGATIGQTAKLGVEATTNQACAVLYNIDNTTINTDYLWLYLQSQTEKLKSMAYGGAQPNINAGIVANYLIPLPPMEVQNEIVAHVFELKKQIKSLRVFAATTRAKTIQQFEQTIFE